MFSLTVPSRLSQKVTSLYWVLFLSCHPAIGLGLVVQLLTHNDEVLDLIPIMRTHKFSCGEEGYHVEEEKKLS